MAEFLPDPTERIGYWDFKVAGDTYQWSLDTSRFLRDVMLRMRTIEEKVTRKLVVEKLRELGYTVIEPEESDHG
jgi:hypothetical protein